jgi:hypothetical protein
MYLSGAGLPHNQLCKWMVGGYSFLCSRSHQGAAATMNAVRPLASDNDLI